MKVSKMRAQTGAYGVSVVTRLTVYCVNAHSYSMRLRSIVSAF